MKSAEVLMYVFALISIAMFIPQGGEVSAGVSELPVIQAQGTRPPPPGSFPPVRPPPPNGVTGPPIPDGPGRPSLIPPPDKPQNGSRSPRDLNPRGDPDVQRGIDRHRREHGR